MLSNFIRLFYPESCAACHGFLLQDEFVICTHCRHQLPTTLHHIEPRNEIHQKFYGRVPLIFGAALLYFHKKGLVQELIHQLKYKGNESVGNALGMWHGMLLKDCPISPYPDFIIPVPLHPKKMKERGYNQVTTYSEALGQTLNIPIDSQLLQRNLYSKTQTKKTILGRTEIVQSIFSVHYEQQHHNKHFVLVDDVITTGSTLEACARELLKIPGAQVSILCMAMSQ